MFTTKYCRPPGRTWPGQDDALREEGVNPLKRKVGGELTTDLDILREAETTPNDARDIRRVKGTLSDVSMR